MPLNELWVEAEVVARIEKACEELGWRAEAMVWDIDLFFDPDQPPVRVSHGVFGGKAGVRLEFPGRCQVRGMVDHRSLEFLMRRNAQLFGCHWSLSRFSGPVATVHLRAGKLTAATLRDAVQRLREERDLVLAAVEEGQAAV